jgi:hypothetical protein
MVWAAVARRQSGPPRRHHPVKSQLCRLFSSEVTATLRRYAARMPLCDGELIAGYRILVAGCANPRASLQSQAEEVDSSDENGEVFRG